MTIPYRLRYLVRAAEEVFGLSPAAFAGTHKANFIVRPRQVLSYVATTRFGFSLSDVGRMLDKDHTTIFHAREVVSKRLAKRDPETRAMVARLLWAARRVPETKSAALRSRYRIERERAASIDETKPPPGPKRKTGKRRTDRKLVVKTYEPGFPKQKPCIAGCGNTVTLETRNDPRKCPQCTEAHASISHLEGMAA